MTPLWSTLLVNRRFQRVRLDVFPGGAKGARTPDPLLAKQVLFQLSYSPEMSPAKGTSIALSGGLVMATAAERIRGAPGTG
jgi:hypothetical protein